MRGNIRIDASPLSKTAKAVDLGLKEEQTDTNTKYSVRYYAHLESIYTVVIVI